MSIAGKVKESWSRFGASRQTANAKLILQNAHRPPAPLHLPVCNRLHFQRGAFARLHRTAGGKVVMDALSLYLDFINLFLMLLRLFGDRR